MRDLTDYKFYVNSLADSFNAYCCYDDMEEAVDWIWAYRSNYKKLFLMMKAEEESKDIIEEEVEIGRIEYDDTYNIYYWFNISSSNVSGFPVNSPEDIMEMLKINMIVGEPDEDDDTEYEGVQDKSAITLIDDYDIAVDYAGNVEAFHPIK